MFQCLCFCFYFRCACIRFNLIHGDTNFLISSNEIFAFAFVSRRDSWWNIFFLSCIRLSLSISCWILHVVGCWFFDRLANWFVNFISDWGITRIASVKERRIQIWRRKIDRDSKKSNRLKMKREHLFGNIWHQEKKINKWKKRRQRRQMRRKKILLGSEQAIWEIEYDNDESANEIEMI